MLCVSLTPAFARCKPNRATAAGPPSLQTGGAPRQSPRRATRLARGGGSVQWIEAEPVELDAPSPGEFPGLEALFAEHGTPLRRLEGTVVSLPQAEHVVWVSTRSRATAAPAGRLARLLLQALHRFGSFLKFLSAKNCCSPAVQTNSVAQSTHLRIRSWNSIGRHLVGVGLRYSDSRRSFFRFRFRARACFARRLSPGFK